MPQQVLPWSDETSGKSARTRGGASLSAIQSEAPERKLRHDTHTLRDENRTCRDSDGSNVRAWRQRGSTQVFVIPWQETTKQVTATQSLSVWHFPPSERLPLSHEWHQSESQKSYEQHHEPQIEFLQRNCEMIKSGCVWSVTVESPGCRGGRGGVTQRSAVVAPVSAGERQPRHRWPRSAPPSPPP